MILLDTIDTRVLSYIRKEEAHTSLIADELCIPRTNVAYRLRRLEKFGRVESKTVGRKTIWRLAKKREHNKELIREFAGTEYYECYKILFTLKKEDSLYVLQGIEAGRAEFKTIPHYLIEDIHRHYKRKKIIMHSVINKEILSVFSEISEHLRASHTGRVQNVRAIDSLFTSCGECFVSKDFLLIVNPQKKRGLLIKEADIVSLINDFMKLFFTFSDQLESIDLNRHLTKVNT